MNLTISLASDGEEGLLHRMMQLYLYDFSEFSDVLVDEHALFGDSEFIEQQFGAENITYVFRVDGVAAGFAIISHESWLSQNKNVTDMAQFFVMRMFRRTGVGSVAAQRLFNTYAGNWEVRVIEENLHALSFWRKTIDSFTNNKYKEETIDDSEEPGTVFRFKSPE